MDTSVTDKPSALEEARALEDFYGIPDDAFHKFQTGIRKDYAQARRSVEAGGSQLLGKIVQDIQIGTHTYGYANIEQKCMKVTGVALGAAMTAYGLYHAYEGLSEEPRPELSHEGVNWRHAVVGAAGAATGLALMHISHRAGRRDPRVLEDFNRALNKAGKAFSQVGLS